MLVQSQCFHQLSSQQQQQQQAAVLRYKALIHRPDDTCQSNKQWMEVFRHTEVEAQLAGKHSGVLNLASKDSEGIGE